MYMQYNIMVQRFCLISPTESQFHEAERFRWLSKDSLCVLVYLVSTTLKLNYSEKESKTGHTVVQSPIDDYSAESQKDRACAAASS